MCNNPAPIDVNKVRGEGSPGAAKAPDAPLDVPLFVAAFIHIKSGTRPEDPWVFSRIKVNFCACFSYVHEGWGKCVCRGE